MPRLRLVIAHGSALCHGRQHRDQDVDARTDAVRSFAVVDDFSAKRRAAVMSFTRQAESANNSRAECRKVRPGRRGLEAPVNSLNGAVSTSSKAPRKAARSWNRCPMLDRLRGRYTLQPRPWDRACRSRPLRATALCGIRPRLPCYLGESVGCFLMLAGFREHHRGFKRRARFAAFCPCQ